MDIGFKSFARLARYAPQGAGAAGVAIDWHGLVARLAAARALQQVLATQAGLAPRAVGSFDAVAARCIAGFAVPSGLAGEELSPVNPTISADRKADRALTALAPTASYRALEG